jgi:hypothetical protein
MEDKEEVAAETAQAKPTLEMTAKKKEAQAKSTAEMTDKKKEAQAKSTAEMKAKKKKAAQAESRVKCRNGSQSTCSGRDNGFTR